MRYCECVGGKKFLMDNVEYLLEDNGFIYFKTGLGNFVKGKGDVFTVVLDAEVKALAGKLPWKTAVNLFPELALQYPETI